VKPAGAKFTVYVPAVVQVTVTVHSHASEVVFASQPVSTRVSALVPRPEAETAQDTVAFEARTAEDAVYVSPGADAIMLLVPGRSS
jgi:hypothetical protein